MKMRKYYTINQHNLITQAFKKEAYNKIDILFTVRDFANLLAISPNHLNKCVKEITGDSASKIINNLKIIEAKYYLSQTFIPITEVASKVGYTGSFVLQSFF